jgi:phosphomannomutase/phosphoglucomutase
MIAASVFRAYDLRGVYGIDFDEHGAEEVGRAYASLVRPGTVVIGSDNRESSPALKESLARGLLESGVDVIDVGEVPTPLLNFATIVLGADGGIMVTASHLEKWHNGFKPSREQALPLADTEIQQLKGIIERGGPFEVSARQGDYREERIEDRYIGDLVHAISLPDDGGISVAVDTGNGTGGPVIRDLLRALGVRATLLFAEPDGTFPNHHPDPTQEETLAPLRETVLSGGCDLGIAMDGDADRVVFLDETGEVVRGDQALALFSREALGESFHSKVLFEVKCSRLLPEDIELHGGIPVMGRTGHSFIKRQMRDDPLIAVAGEMSGHFFFREFHSIDDPFFATAKMISILAKSRWTLSDHLGTLPQYAATPEIRVPVDESRKFIIVDELESELQAMSAVDDSIRIIDIDGIRVEFPDGWGLVRASNTSPYLILRFEAKTEERMKEIQALITGKLERWL